MEQTLTELTAYFEEQIAQCKQREQALIQAARKDEANFEKIRGNIFDIFRTVLSAAEKNCPHDPAALADFFMKQLRQIPSGWKIACEKAARHGDTVQAHIEEIKLQAVKEIEEKCREVWGEVL